MKNKNRKDILVFPGLILCLLLFSHFAAACSCANVPDNFAKNIQANHVVLSAIVIEQIEFDNLEKSLVFAKSLTKLKVTHWYQNSMYADTIYYVNGEGAACGSSIAYANIGEELVIKARKELNFIQSNFTGKPFPTILGFYNFCLSLRPKFESIAPMRCLLVLV